MILHWLMSGNGSLVQIIWYALIIVSLWVTEVVICMEEPLCKWRHSRLNFAFIFTALSIQLLLTPIELGVSEWVNANNWGLISLIPGSHHWLVHLLGTFFLLDFFEYLYHVIMHKTRLFWKFHIVHHTDKAVDVSTTVREHPGETFIRLCFTITWVFLSGASIATIIFRQTFQTAFNLLAHSTVKFPGKFERNLGFVFITPEIHRVHHHYELPHTDSNYGDILSIWDRMFGTLHIVPEQELVFGIDTHFEEAEDDSFKDLLKIPFSEIPLAEDILIEKA